MNQINTIYTTVSKGQVHIAADTKYIGSVDSYNNCFTRLFAKIFGRSMKVHFDGKTRSINKKSYANLIRSLTQNDEINNIRQRSIFRPIAESAALPQNNLKMRDVVSSNVRQKLFTKLAMAISQGDTRKALLMIGKGAELDTVYYDRGRLSPSFSTDAAGLNATSRYNFTVFKAAPVMQAARKGNIAVCQFLKDAGANLSIRGKEYTFRREILSVERRLEVVAQPTMVPHHYHTRDRNGAYRHQVRHHMEYRPQLQQRTIVNTQDSRVEEINYQLEQSSFNVMEV